MDKREISQKFEQIYNDMLIQTQDKEQLAYYTASKEKFKYILGYLPLDEIGNKEVLDIGVSRFTYILKQIYPDLKLTALDFQDCEKELKMRRINFIRHNLERDADNLPQNTFDIIIFSEVLEHLAVSPRVIFKKLHRMLKNDGILITTTPNVLSLANRIKCIMGQTPIETIRENLQNPGHFREYSIKELKEYLSAAGFKIIKEEFPKYWSNINMVLKVNKLRGRGIVKLYFLYLPFSILRKILTSVLPTLDAAIALIAQKAE